MDCRMYVEAEVGKKVSRKCYLVPGKRTWHLCVLDMSVT